VFFYLSKILSFLIAPAMWIFVLLVWAVFTKNEIRRRKLLIWSVSLFFFFGNSFVVDECFRQWETVTEDIDLQQTKYDAAVILGGVGDIDLRLQKINFGYSADRVFQALPLYYKGRFRKLIFTGGSGSIEFPDKREGIFVGKYLREIQFPDSALIIESASRNTYENAIFTKRITDSLQLHNILLITSAFHMPRALAIFRKAGFKNVTPYITNKFSGMRRFTPDHLLIPNAGALMSVQLLIHEWIGYIIYKMKGYA
jgi:uncharacterized SAM-binding protein YcdF (DUF218 family)